MYFKLFNFSDLFRSIQNNQKGLFYASFLQEFITVIYRELIDLRYGFGIESYFIFSKDGIIGFHFSSTCSLSSLSFYVWFPKRIHLGLCIHDVRFLLISVKVYWTLSFWVHFALREISKVVFFHYFVTKFMMIEERNVSAISWKRFPFQDLFYFLN